MGFDYYLEVIGELNLRDFINDCLIRCEKKFISKYGDNYRVLIDANKLFVNLIDREKFFNNVIVSFDNCDFTVEGYNQSKNVEEEEEEEAEAEAEAEDEDEDGDEKKDDKNEPNYDCITLIFLEIFLMAIDEKDPCLKKYCSVFDCFEGFKVTKNQTVKITIEHISSYKGRDKLTVNFLEISNRIEQIENLLPSINIYTQINQC